MACHGSGDDPEVRVLKLHDNDHQDTTLYRLTKGTTCTLTHGWAGIRRRCRLGSSTVLSGVVLLTSLQDQRGVCDIRGGCGSDIKANSNLKRGVHIGTFALSAWSRPPD